MKEYYPIMHLRCWVYRRNLSNNPESPFRSNADIMQKAGCFISGLLGIVFLGLALLCYFSPQADKDGKLFLIFTGLFGICEVICFIYSCIPCFKKYCRSSDDDEEDESSRSSLLSSEENSYQEVPGYQGIASYQASAGLPEVSGYQGIASYQASAGYAVVPSYQELSYQAGPSYREVPSYHPAPYNAEGGNFPGLATLRPLVNYEGVFLHQEIPIYQQDLIEPQLPPYSSGYIQRSTTPPNDILVY